MRVYYQKRLIIVETNVAWALPYWVGRKLLDNHITWEFT